MSGREVKGDGRGRGRGSGSRGRNGERSTGDFGEDISFDIHTYIHT